MGGPFDASKVAKIEVIDAKVWPWKLTFYALQCHLESNEGWNG